MRPYSGKTKARRMGPIVGTSKRTEGTVTLVIPPALKSILDKYDDPDTWIEEFKVAGELLAVLGDANALSPDERRGAFAEIEALRFRRAITSERRTWGIYWAEVASLSGNDGQTIYSPDIADIDNDILSHWISRSQSARHPVMRARFADLAWEIGRVLKKSSKQGKPLSKSPATIDIPVSLCHRAIDGYLAAVETSVCKEVDAWHALDRAIELSVSINDTTRLQNAKTRLFAFYKSNENKKSMWWRLDDITLERDKALRLEVEEVATVLSSLHAALANHSDVSKNDVFNPHLSLDAADRIVRRCGVSSEEAKQAIRKAGLAFEEAAKSADGLVAIAWLEDLLPRYRNVGLLEDVVRLEQAIRSRATDAQKEMKHIEVLVNIPKVELDEWAERITGTSIDEALSRIAVACLIREDSTRESIKKLTETAPLMSMMPTAIMDNNGFTVATVGSVEDDLEGRSLQHAAHLLNWQASWLYLAINKTKEKYGLDVDKLMAMLLRSPYFTPSMASLLRDGLDAWLGGDAIKAIHVLVPQLEAALREILIALGVPIMVKDPRINGFKVMNMGAMLANERFEKGALRDIRFHFRALYCDPRGINLRNQLAHGIARPELFGTGLANWVLHSLLVIGLLREPKKV